MCGFYSVVHVHALLLRVEKGVSGHVSEKLEEGWKGCGLF